MQLLELLGLVQTVYTAHSSPTGESPYLSTESG